MTAATTPDEGWQLGYRPALDGLRGVAVLLVMAWHAGLPFGRGGGWMGVTIFFVLSGFLITRLLAEERQRTGHISFVAFYKRRVRRLGPALAVLIAATIGFQALTDGLALRQVSQAVIAATYSANWISIAGGDLMPYGQVWTLAIEEQFYVVWPAAVVGLCAIRPRYALAILTIGVVASIAIRMASSDVRAALGTDTRADALLIGAIAALIAGRVHMPGAVVAAGAGGLVALMALEPHPFGIQFGLTLAPPLIAVVILGALDRPLGLNAGWLRGVGRISYGLYLWHYVPMLYLSPLIEPWPVRGAALFGIAFVLAWLSWRFVERPFLRPRVDQHDTRRERGSAPQELTVP